jgi:hypothetical protein
MKYYFIFLVLPFVLMSKELDSEHPLENKNTFIYCETGIDGVEGINLVIGNRHIHNMHAWDINGGAAIVFYNKNLYPIPFVQTSYLFYPKSLDGPYFGAGISMMMFFDSIFPVCPDLPLTIGFQFPKTSHPQFIQFQFGALLNSYTLSYAIGF